VPVIIGSNGVEKIIEINFTTEEEKMFRYSVDAVKHLVEILYEADPSLLEKK
jgi:malate dehydrogenase